MIEPRQSTHVPKTSKTRARTFVTGIPARVRAYDVGSSGGAGCLNCATDTPNAQGIREADHVQSEDHRRQAAIAGISMRRGTDEAERLWPTGGRPPDDRQVVVRWCR